MLDAVFDIGGSLVDPSWISPVVVLTNAGAGSGEVTTRLSREVLSDFETAC